VNLLIPLLIIVLEVLFGSPEREGAPEVEATVSATSLEAEPRPDSAALAPPLCSLS